MVDLAAQRQKIENLNSTDTRVIDTIAGALLRIFVRLEESDAELERLRRRVRELETAPLGEAERPANKVAATSERKHTGQHLWTKAPARRPNACFAAAAE